MPSEIHLEGLVDAEILDLLRHVANQRLPMGWMITPESWRIVSRSFMTTLRFSGSLSASAELGVEIRVE
jgi:hypothetical protein